MLKEGMAKVRLWSYLVQKAKNWVQLGFSFHWNCSNKVLLGFSSIEYAKIKHDGVLISKMLKKDVDVVLYYEDAKIRYGWGLLLFNKQK